jgi:DNA-binding MarR family transcriptional regulator
MPCALVAGVSFKVSKSTLYAWDRLVWSKDGPTQGNSSLALRGTLKTLFDYMVTYDEVYVSQEALAEKGGCNRKAISRHLAQAEKLGWIERTTKQHGVRPRTYFRVRVPDGLAQTLAEIKREIGDKLR